MIQELVKSTDPVLKQKAEKFSFVNPSVDPIDLARDLADTMVAHGGLGLAAHQIGLPYNAFAMGRGGDKVFVCFNPLIVNTSTERVKMKEGCLSFPGLILNILRPIAIRVRYTQPNGEVTTQDFTGMTARIFQHEFDHVQGKLFTDYVSRLELDIAKRKAKKFR